MTEMTTGTTTGTTTVPDSAARVTRSVVVAAPPSAVFALLAEPAHHPDLDGSGTVREAVGEPGRLELGSVFRMRMKGYTTTNTVVEHREDALIAWRHRGRHVWRWELRAVPGGTEVTETFDYTAKRFRSLVELLGVPARAAASIDQTLTGLVARFS